MNTLKKSPADDLTRALKDVALPDDVHQVSFETLQASSTGEKVIHDVGLIMDLPVQVMVELGRTRMSIGELMGVERGAVIELDVKAGDPLRLVVNGCLLAMGEVVISNDRYGIRLTDIISPSERLRSGP